MARVFPRLALLALCVSAWCVSAAPSRVLFPNNLHLTRQVHDPISGTVTTIEEYCSGNRMVAISGDRTVIVDYDKQEITEIRRGAGTYSVSRFDEIASAVSDTAKATNAASAKPRLGEERWKVTPRGLGSAANRSVDRFEFVDSGEIRRRVDVGIDRSVTLTREALEVLIGAAYPNPVRDEHEPIFRAANARGTGPAVATSEGASEDKPTYGLPVTQEFTYSDSGTELTFRTAITRIGNETVPAEALIIPPAAKRVESTAAAVRRQLRDLDHPAATPATPRN